METKDLIVIGGGINGAGIAADAAGRGLSVLMLEARDLACATSSASSKLIHGGLRYLEHYEFRLVSEALAEREVLLKMAPHIAFPMRFRLPHRPHLRPAWMIRIGLFMYDHLGKRTSLPGSTGLRFGAESVLKPEIVRGFEYSDCWVDDARLVLANAQMVVRKGGEVRTRTRAISAKRENGLWVVEAEDIDSGEKFTWKARGLVNATGPWVKQFFDEGMHLRSPYGIRLIKGSHIVVPRVHDQLLPVGGGRNAAPAAVEHREAHLAFDLLYRGGQAGLGYVQQLGRLVYAACVGNGGDVAHLLKRHLHTSV